MSNLCLLFKLLCCCAVVLSCCCAVAGQYKLHLSTDNPLLPNGTKHTSLAVSVVECPVGYATASRDNCVPCLRGYYSFDPADKECSWCPANAVCTGVHSGVPQIWPEEGWWHSAPRSIQMHR